MTGSAARRGSHATRGDYPADCHGCGKRVRVTVDTCWYEHDHRTREKRAWHWECRLRGKAAT